MKDDEPCANPYYDSLDRTASDIRDELRNRIQEAVNSNQECFIAHWLLQNPYAELSKLRLNHGFKGGCYEFWVEEVDSEYIGMGKYGPLEGELQ